MTTAQLNTRIDASLKNSGDLAIREGGTTPSAIVRSVWEYAARNRHRPQAIGELQDFLAEKRPAVLNGGADSESADGELVSQVLRGPRLVEECLLKMGVETAGIAPMTYEDARAAAFDEEWEEALAR